MTAIRIEDFGGRIPRRSARLLPPNAAQVATDTKLFSGELRGWNKALLRKTLSGTGIQTVFRIPDPANDVWFESIYDNVHVQKGTLINDLYDRFYWTSGTDDVPRYSTKTRIAAGDPSYILGIPPPSTAPTTSDVGTPISALTATYVFVYTFVSDLGEESAPSPPVTWTGPTDEVVRLSGLETTFAGIGERPFASGTKRVYRTITSVSGQTNFFLAVEDIPMATLIADISIGDPDIGYSSLLESSGWNQPPDELEGLITHPNGFMVGFVGRDIYFSEPYRAHAWPAEYVLSCDFEIMGLGIVGNTIGITTRSNPYACTGIRPNSMSLTKSTTVEPCLSKKGVVTLPSGIMYPSNNGLAWLNPAGATVVTRQFMTKEEWQNDFNPQTINAARYETRYMGFTSATRGFVYDPVEQKSAVVDLSRGQPITDVYTDVYSGLVHLLESDRIFEWDPPENTVPVTYTWKSRVFEFPKPLNFGAGVVKFNDSDFQADSGFVALLEAVNTAVLATIPTNKLGSINYTGFNTRRRINVSSYLDEMADVPTYQSSAFNGSDLKNISEFQVTVASTHVTVWADGREIWCQPVLKNTVFRLPTGFKAHTYEVQVTANTDVYSIALAETPKELRIA